MEVFSVGKHLAYSCTLQSTCSYCSTLDMWLHQAVILHNEDTHGIPKMSNDKTPAKYLPFLSWSHVIGIKQHLAVGMAAHNFSLALGRLREGGFWVWYQPGVHSKFHLGWATWKDTISKPKKGNKQETEKELLWNKGYLQNSALLEDKDLTNK